MKTVRQCWHESTYPYRPDCRRSDVTNGSQAILYRSSVGALHGSRESPACGNKGDIIGMVRPLPRAFRDIISGMRDA